MTQEVYSGWDNNNLEKSKFPLAETHMPWPKESLATVGEPTRKSKLPPPLTEAKNVGNFKNNEQFYRYLVVPCVLKLQCV